MPRNAHTLFLSLAMAVATHVHAQDARPAPPGSDFVRNTYLGNGKSLVARSGKLFLVQQDDGNLCLYHGTPQRQGPFIKCSLGASQARGPYFTVFQNDGNICTYKGTGPADSKGGVWCSKTARGPGHYTASVEDGGFTLYAGYSPVDWNRVRLWSLELGVDNPSAKPKPLFTAGGPYANCLRKAESSRPMIARTLPMIRPTATTTAAVIQTYQQGFADLDKQWAAMERGVTDTNNPASVAACEAVANKYVEMSKALGTLR